MLAALVFQVVLGSVRVIDGDTLHHNGGADYRLAGVDAPEIGGRAACDRERVLGELARDFVADLIRGADQVVAYPAHDVRGPRVWPMTLGRRLARIEVDGDDLAARLVAQGLAAPRVGGQVWDWCDGAGRG